MDHKLLKPDRFSVEPGSAHSEKSWKHFYRTFVTCIEAVPGTPNKFGLLCNCVSSDVYSLIEDSDSYEAAIVTLKRLYIKPVNTVYARHQLATCRQQPHQSIDDYLQKLKHLAKDCKFEAVTANQHRDEYVRDAFISGLISNQIRQRLLENVTLDLATMFDQARSLDTAQKSSESYTSSSYNTAAVQPPIGKVEHDSSHNNSTQHIFRDQSAAVKSKSCYFCGRSPYHPRFRCPAKNSTCDNCGKRGHWREVCKGETSSSSTVDRNPTHQSAVAYNTTPHLASINSNLVSKSRIKVQLHGEEFSALIDSGSDLTFIHPNLLKRWNLKTFPMNRVVEVAMADTNYSVKVHRYCVLQDLRIQNRVYRTVEAGILPGSCADIILGVDFQSRHSDVTIQYGGKEPPLIIGALGTLNINPPALFTHITPDIKPIAAKSRRYSKDDRVFIDREVKRLLADGIIVKSTSPWRAQVLVTREGTHKQRLVFDYSETINRFTRLDAYPVPRIDETVDKISKFKVFSTIDLKSAYHQVQIRAEDRQFTAFEANGGLYEFTRLPFGVTNGVTIFQREMDRFIEENSLEATYAYMDNITICGHDQAHHDRNLRKFMDAASHINLTYNCDKCDFSTTSLKILGYLVENGMKRPDPDRLRPLVELPVPNHLKALRRALGLFSYYSQWIQNYSDKIRPLLQSSSFPLTNEAEKAFITLKMEIADSVVSSVDETVPFTVETDASDYVLAAALNQ